MGIYLIAEAGVNHNGDPTLAEQLVDAAARAGADAVKFQTFRADALVAPHAPKAAYQQETTGSAESQLEMIRRLELPYDVHLRLAARCRERGVDFLSSPFDLESLAFLVREMDMPRLKIPSGELTDGPLLLAAARSGRELILSTGMSDLGETRAALGLIAFGMTTPTGDPTPAACAAALTADAGRARLRERMTLLHCTTEYPTPFGEVNLTAMTALREAFGLPVGYSDHTPGIHIPMAAAALGAVAIEKHFTLDRDLPGPDHRASLLPDELAAMVRGVRAVEAALGDGVKRPTTGETRNRTAARRSLAAVRPIRRGEPFTPDNLGTMRPGSGISPMAYWDWLGRSAHRDYRPGDLIDAPTSGASLHQGGGHADTVAD